MSYRELGKSIISSSLTLRVGLLLILCFVLLIGSLFILGEKEQDQGTNADEPAPVTLDQDTQAFVSKANTKLTQFWVLLAEKQDAYYARHGRYFQLIITPDEAVIDGVDSTFEIKSPNYQPIVRQIDFPWASKIPFQIEVNTIGDDTYEAVVRAELRDGRKFIRSRDNHGNDTGWINYKDI